MKKICFLVSLYFSSIVVCFDAKINFDDNAEFRQKAVFAMDDMSESDPTETEAAKWDLKYIGLDGNIACFGEFFLLIFLPAALHSLPLSLALSLSYTPMHTQSQLWLDSHTMWLCGFSCPGFYVVGLQCSLSTSRWLCHVQIGTQGGESDTQTCPADCTFNS